MDGGWLLAVFRAESPHPRRQNAAPAANGRPSRTASLRGLRAFITLTPNSSMDLRLNHPMRRLGEGDWGKPSRIEVLSYPRSNPRGNSKIHRAFIFRKQLPAGAFGPLSPWGTSHISPIRCRLQRRQATSSSSVSSPCRSALAWAITFSAISPGT